GTTSRLGGIGLDEIAKDIETRHRFAYQDNYETLSSLELAEGGEYQWRRNGEYHLFNPFTIFKLQYSTKSGNYKVFKEYTKAIDDQSSQLATLRGLMRLRTDGEVRPAVPIEEVEPVTASILPRPFKVQSIISPNPGEQPACHTLFQKVHRPRLAPEPPTDVSRLCIPARE
ncbi:glutamate synthase, large subunit, partial [mine drainage metagenome]